MLSYATLSLALAFYLNPLPPGARFPTVPARFHDEYVDQRDGLHVIDAWSLADRFPWGSGWLAHDPRALADYVARINRGEVRPGPNRSGPYRWIPAELDPWR